MSSRSLSAAVRRLSREDGVLLDDRGPVRWIGRGLGLAVQAFPGGSLTLRSPASIGTRVLHIVPHGGVNVPSRWRSACEPADVNDLARALYRDHDRGTNAVAQALARRLHDRPDHALAYFNLAWTFANANRRGLDRQIPRSDTQFPSILAAEVRADDLLRAGIADRYLRPWLRGTHELLQSARIAVHHHTYKRVGDRSARERRHGDPRPRGGQLFRYRSSPSGEFSDEPLLRPERWESARATLEEWLSEEGCPEPAIREDVPFTELPPLPFVGSSVGDPWAPEHLICDLHQDELRTGDSVAAYVDRLLRLTDSWI